MKLTTYNRTSLGRIYLFIRSIFVNYKEEISKFIVILFAIPFILLILRTTLFGSYDYWLETFDMSTYYNETFFLLAIGFVAGYYILVNRYLNVSRVPHAMALPVKSGEKMVALIIIGILTNILMFLVPYLVTVIVWLIHMKQFSYEPLWPMMYKIIAWGAFYSFRDVVLMTLVVTSCAFTPFYFAIYCRKVVSAFLSSVVVSLGVLSVGYLIFSQLKGFFDVREAYQNVAERLFILLLLVYSVGIIYYSYVALKKKEVKS